MSYHLTHPDSDVEIEREAEDVPMYLAAGWQVRSGAKVPESDPALAEAPQRADQPHQ